MVKARIDASTKNGVCSPVSQGHGNRKSHNTVLIPQNRYKRKETWSEEHPGGVAQAIYIQLPKKVGQISFDIFWIKNKPLAELDNIPDQDVLVGKIIDKLEIVIESFCDL
jgi:hypothetical protein